MADITPYRAAFTAADAADIPREDIPFVIAEWHGTGGSTRSGRNGNKIIQWFAP